MTLPSELLRIGDFQAETITGCDFTSSKPKSDIRMNPLKTVLKLIVVTACMSGCNPGPKAPTGATTTQPADAGTRLLPIDNVLKLSDDALKAFEQKFACQLPQDYRKFLLQNNGGFPSPDCISFKEAGHETASDVFCFFTIGDDRKWASIDWHCDTYSGRLPKDTLPIARDSCGNLWLLAVARESSGSVFFWDHGSYNTFDETDLANWPRVAASFEEFYGKLSAYDSAAVNQSVPSRYALVKQAVDGMSKKDTGFSTRANPGFVWHCDCSEDGKVSMQFVKYEVHAFTTHTDGYSQLRSLNGLIKAGQTRLPQ